MRLDKRTVKSIFKNSLKKTLWIDEIDEGNYVVLCCKDCKELIEKLEKKYSTLKNEIRKWTVRGFDITYEDLVEMYKNYFLLNNTRLKKRIEEMKNQIHHPLTQPQRESLSRVFENIEKEIEELKEIVEREEFKEYLDEEIKELREFFSLPSEDENLEYRKDKVKLFSRYLINISNYLILFIITFIFILGVSVMFYVLYEVYKLILNLLDGSELSSSFLKNIISLFSDMTIALIFIVLSTRIYSEFKSKPSNVKVKEIDLELVEKNFLGIMLLTMFVIVFALIMNLTPQNIDIILYASISIAVLTAAASMYIYVREHVKNIGQKEKDKSINSARDSTEEQQNDQNHTNR